MHAKNMLSQCHSMAMSRESITMIEIVQSLYRLANFYQLVKFVVKFVVKF